MPLVCGGHKSCNKLNLTESCSYPSIIVENVEELKYLGIMVTHETNVHKGIKSRGLFLPLRSYSFAYPSAV
jgi:hypothetical protein